MSKKNVIKLMVIVLLVLGFTTVTQYDRKSSVKELPLANSVFYSTRWDVQFAYTPKIGSDDVRVQEVADKIYLYKRTSDFIQHPVKDLRLGQYLAIFEKDLADSLSQAITKRILVYPGQEKKCTITPEIQESPHITRATIEFTELATSTGAPKDLDRQGICSAYRGVSATHYFWMDDRFPDRFFFYSLDSSDFMAIADTGEQVPWYKTITIQPHILLEYPPPHYGNFVKIKSFEPRDGVKVGDDVHIIGTGFDAAVNELYFLPGHMHSENWWKSWYCVMRYTNQVYPATGGTMVVKIPIYLQRGWCTDHRGMVGDVKDTKGDFTLFLHNKTGLYMMKEPFSVLF